MPLKPSPNFRSRRKGEKSVVSEEEEENNAGEVGHGRKGIVIIKRDFIAFIHAIYGV